MGMGWSTGSEFARRAVDAVFGPRTISVVSESPVVAAPAPATTSVDAGSGACGHHSKAFEDCLNNSGNDIGKCQFFFDMLTECKRNIESMMDS
ncbi:uncharacterized protein LOC132316608 [Cornus florida]|uniref:uncharacterized protein LOC132316608 n=1 Tax=Cornus florida TaxID=4283 RepID=UPI0028A1644C|nr:uncharacterized protein LOC132316608 [Cornus florida]